MGISILTHQQGYFTKFKWTFGYTFFEESENMHEMTVDTFCVETDSDTGRRYVSKKVDELAKNHREADKDNIEGFMPENPGNNICPVSTYIKYVSKLNKNCNRLRQRSKDSFHDDDEVWFCNVPVGKQTLAGFISGLSKKMNLSKSYPSHRIRATEATLLSRNQFGAAQIMSVTGIVQYVCNYV